MGVTQALSTPGVRAALVTAMVLGLGVALVATVVALNFLTFHGFAPACATGYAEATGEPPCTPDWEGAATSLWVLAGSTAMALAAGVALLAGRSGVQHIGSI